MKKPSHLKCTFGRRFEFFAGTLLLAATTLSPVGAANYLKIEPSQVELTQQSCLAFGAGPGSGTEGDGFVDTSPYMGFIYRDVPAFTLEPGDILAFDLAVPNDFDVEIDIAMAATTENGGAEQAEPFTQVVSNSSTPASPRGDSIVGNFDLQFVVETNYAFPGGGLIIRFANGSPAYRQDVTCTQVGVTTSYLDPSGQFVTSFFGDEDGVAPWQPLEPDQSVLTKHTIIGGFVIDDAPFIGVAADTLDASENRISLGNIGDTVTLRVHASNSTATDASNVIVSVALDPDIDFVSSLPAEAVFDPGPPKTVTWTLDNLPAGTSEVLDVVLEVPANGNDRILTNSATVTAVDAPLLAAHVSDSILFTGPAPTVDSRVLDQSGTETPTAAVGEALTYEISIENSDDLDATDVEVKIVLPLDTDVGALDASGLTSASFEPMPLPTVTWNIGDLAIASQETLSVDVVPAFPSSGNFQAFSGAVTGPIRSGSNTPAVVTIDDAIELSDQILNGSGDVVDTAGVGETVGYEISLSNVGLGEGTNIEVTATIDSNLEFVDASPASATINQGPPTTATWVVDSISGGTVTPLTATVRVPSGIAVATTNLAAEITDSDAANTIGETTASTLSIGADLTMSSRTIDDAGNDLTSAIVGDIVGYEITLENSGQATSSNLTVAATIDEDLAFIRASRPEASFEDESPAMVIWDIPSIAPNEMVSLNIELGIESFDANGKIAVNSAEIASANEPLAVGQMTSSEFSITDVAADILENGGDGACFIATAAYGSYIEPEVMVLREFRDRYLLPNEPGREFVDWYYRVSPPLAEQLRKNDFARFIVRTLLAPLVYIVKYPYIPIALLLALTGFAGRRFSNRELPA